MGMIGSLEVRARGGWHVERAAPGQPDTRGAQYWLTGVS